MYIWELILIAVSLSADAFAVSMCRGLEMRRINVRHAFVIALFFGLFQAAMPVIGYFAAKLVADYITAYDHWIAFGLLALLGAKMIYDGIKEGAEERKRRKEARDVTAPALPCPAGEKTEPAANLAATANLAETAAPVLTETAAANGQGAEAEGSAQAASACACKGKGGATGERLDVKKLLVMSVATSIDALAIGVTFAFLDVNLWLAVYHVRALAGRRIPRALHRREIQRQSHRHRRRGARTYRAQDTARAPRRDFFLKNERRRVTFLAVANNI